MTPPRVRPGLDRWLEAPGDFVTRAGVPRTGLLAHPPSLTTGWEHAVDAHLRHPAFRLTRLFGPEHGLRGEAQDMATVGHGTDPLSGLPVVSLYGDTFESLTPTPDDLADLDLLVIDLQDVGSRYYTFVATALLAARAAARAGIPAVLLDRPNPIGGAIEGPGLQAGFESFVGLFDMPIRHGLTAVEILRWVQRFTAFFDGCDPALLVGVPCEGWRRSMAWEETGLPWVLPSPNMPTVDTAWVYPGGCLFEGTSLSEGRGTTRPFELVGAPWVDAQAWKRALDALELPGVVFRPCRFEPGFQKWARQGCAGLQLHVTARRAFAAVDTGAALIHTACALFPDFQWRSDAYEFVVDIPAIDLLFGDSRVREAIDARAPWPEVRALLQTPPDCLDRVHAAHLAAYDD